MNVEAIAAYEYALSSASELSLVAPDGETVVELDMSRYLGQVDDADLAVLDLTVAPVLDVGCGPGRIVGELARRGHAALGVDIAHEAVRLSARRGAAALVRNIFDRLPGEGRWPTIVVLDGNIGIGGDVDAFLARMTDLLGPDGQLIVEASVHDDDAPVDDVIRARFRSRHQIENVEFDWARVDGDALVRRAARLGLTCTRRWTIGNRTFLRLQRTQAGA